ncbi:MAG TPA: ATP-binding protein [Terriglobia bacterium]|nr:ATP-binding protein [Terriglobia bacterium]
MALKAPRSFELTVPSRLEALEEVQRLVTEATREYQLSEDFSYWMELTICESMINAIRHGNQCDPSKNARLKISLNGSQIEIIVEDQGHGFKLNELADPTETKNLLKPSGRGILIIRSFMDEVDLTECEGGGSRLRMIKRIPGNSK